MIFIWKGFGFLVPLIAIGFFLLANVAANLAMNDPNYYSTHGWPKFVAGLLSAVSIFVLGRYLNARVQTFFDPELGRNFQACEEHSLYWIKFEYWSIACLAIALAFGLGK